MVGVIAAGCPAERVKSPDQRSAQMSSTFGRFSGMMRPQSIACAGEESLFPTVSVSDQSGRRRGARPTNHL